MKRASVALEPTGLLVDRLDREFDAQALASMADGAAGDLPWRLWRTALYDPLHDFLSRPGKEFRGELLLACWHLGGRKESPPPELALVVEALHAGSLIVDDIEDGSTERRGAPSLHRLFGVPKALNAGNWLYFWPLQLLDEIEMAEATRAACHRLTRRVLLECHYGQALDLSVRMLDLEQGDVAGVVRAVTMLKTGGLVGLAAALGALVSGAGHDVVSAVMRFGRRLGTGLQMLDDLSGLLNEERFDKGREDLAGARPTWPWAWVSLLVDADSYRSLLSSQRRVAAGAPAEPLARDLAKIVEPDGKRRVHAWLEQAFSELASAVPHRAPLASLRAELERLERSYV
jgi:geranylgeranyl pyrophosphate synthase